MTRRASLPLLGALAWALAAPPARGWARHDLVTAAALERVAWLRALPPVRVTPPPPVDASLNPAFRVVYAPPAPAPATPFVFYSLEAGWWVGFHGAPPGADETPLRILVEYSDEPDWGMDQKLDLSWAQRFQGGSQGWRHMYFPAWSFHVPYPFVPQGEAPGRARHFREIAARFFASGDAYWGWRSLARALHYVEDLGQPFHAYQLPPRLVIAGSPIEGTIQAVTNEHLAFETYVANVLGGEAAMRIPDGERFLSCLKERPPLTPREAARLVRRVARESRRLGPRVVSGMLSVFGDRLRSARSVPLDAASFDAALALPAGERAPLDRPACEALGLTGAAVRAFLEEARGSLKLPPGGGR